MSAANNLWQVELLGQLFAGFGELGETGEKRLTLARTGFGRPSHKTANLHDSHFRAPSVPPWPGRCWKAGWRPESMAAAKHPKPVAAH